MFRLPRKLMHTLIVLKTHEEVSKQLCTYINQLIRQKQCNGSVCFNHYDIKILYISDAMAPINTMTEVNQLFCFVFLSNGCYYSFFLSYDMPNLSILSYQKEIFLAFKKSFLFPKVPSHSLNNAISAQVTRGWG